MTVNNAADDLRTKIAARAWFQKFEGAHGRASEQARAAASSSGDESIGPEDPETGLLSDQRMRRAIEIMLLTAAPLGPKDPRFRGDASWWWRLVAIPEGGPISFKVLGVRWTSGKVIGLLLSVSATVLSALVSYAGRYAGLSYG